MNENIPEWITKLALDIYKVVQEYKAMPHFQKMVDQWAKDRESEIDEWRTWNEQRRLHFEQTVVNDYHLQDKAINPPKQGWLFEDHIQFTGEQTPSGRCDFNIIHGWVPPELSNSKRPEITQLFPLSREHELTLIEKYTVLAVIYDYGRKGTSKIPPWQWPDLNLDQSKKTLSDAKKCLFFEGLCDSVSRLNPDNEGWLRVILCEIETDIMNYLPQQAHNKGFRISKRWRTPTVILTIIIILLTIGVALLPYIKPPPTMESNITDKENINPEKDLVTRTKPLVSVSNLDISQVDPNSAAINFTCGNYSGFIANKIILDVRYGPESNAWIGEYERTTTGENLKLFNLAVGEKIEITGFRGELNLKKKFDALEDRGGKSYPISIRIKWENEYGRPFEHIDKYGLHRTKVDSNETYHFIFEETTNKNY